MSTGAIDIDVHAASATHGGGEISVAMSNTPPDSSDLAENHENSLAHHCQVFRWRIIYVPLSAVCLPQDLDDYMGLLHVALDALERSSPGQQSDGVAAQYPTRTLWQDSDHHPCTCHHLYNLSHQP